MANCVCYAHSMVRLIGKVDHGDDDEAEDDIDGHVRHDVCTHNKYTHRQYLQFHVRQKMREREEEERRKNKERLRRKGRGKSSLDHA